ncbi:hypothetical protein PT276_06425 [Orbaceae bacterium ESL0721]|nr:hypothetical protein [Orbaceae bacterium ESL0721]
MNLSSNSPIQRINTYPKYKETTLLLKEAAQIIKITQRGSMELVSSYLSQGALLTTM